MASHRPTYLLNGKQSITPPWAARGEIAADKLGRLPIKAPRRVVAITGSGGVGKSTLVGKLIEHIRSQGQTVAVLACDPQSPLSGGALLGDRFRMPAQPDDAQIATVSFADAQYDAAVAGLESAVKKGRGRLDANTIAIVEHNLQIIDQAIDQARQALAADPANAYLSSHLFEARRRKLDLLRRAAALSESD